MPMPSKMRSSAPGSCSPGSSSRADARPIAGPWLGSLMPQWTDPAWLRDAWEWIDRELKRLGVVPAGDLEQSHIEPWSTAMRVPVADGDLWFKANMPALASEAAVVDILGRRRPGSVPELLAIDRERGWMLT